MKRYEAYKPTGLEWYPAIPQGWEWRYLFQVAHEQTIKKPAGEMYPIMTLSYGEIKRKKNTEAGLLPSNYDSYQMLYKGNIVLRLIDLQNDHTSLRTGLVKETGIITSAYTCIMPTENPAYAQYLLHSYDTKKVFYGFGGGVRQSIGFKDIRHLQVPVPPREEQDQIVRYLDWQVSKINRLIAAKRKQIELLKEQRNTRIAKIVHNGLEPNVNMRESGIEYIGTVPAHWTVLQNRRLFKSMNRPFQGMPTVLSLSQNDGLIPYAEMTERSMHTSSYDNWQLVHPNDLVLNRFKAHLGVFFASEHTGIVTFHYGVYEAKMPLVAKYYESLYHTPIYCRVYAGQSRGMTVGLQNLSDTNFYSTYTVYPPYEEQCAIVVEIDKTEEQYSKVVTSITGQIENLQEYRSRLISDVVTGQVDVRGIEVPEYEYVGEVSETNDNDEVELEDNEEAD